MTDAPDKYDPSVVIVILAMLVTIACYWSSLQAPFFSDDHVYIVSNENLQRPALESWRFFFERTNPYEFAPLRDLSYRFDYAISGLNPLGYHIHNLVLYLLCGLAMWAASHALGQMLGLRQVNWFAASACVLFLAHPAHVESVAWISGRKELLSGLFVLLAVWELCRALAAGVLRWRVMITTPLLVVAALLSKSAAIGAVPLLVILALGCKSARRQPRKLLGLLSALAAVTMAALLFHGRVGQAAVIVREIQGDWSTRLWLALRVLGYLAEIALAPFNLRLIYDVQQPGASMIVAATIGALVVASGIVGFVYFFRHRSVVALAPVAFIALCFPVLQLIQFHTFSLASERFLFLPVCALVWAVAALITRLNRPGLQRLAVLALVLPLVVLTADYARAWSAPAELLKRMALHAPSNAEAQTRYIRMVLVPQQRWPEAEAAAAAVANPFERTVLIKQVELYEALARGGLSTASGQMAWFSTSLGRHGIGLLHRVLGDYYDQNHEPLLAAKHYCVSARTASSKATRRRALYGLTLARSSQAQRVAQLRREVAVSEDPQQLTELGNVLLDLCHHDEALQIYSMIVQRFPGNGSAHFNVGTALFRMERYQLAAERFETSIRLGYASEMVQRKLQEARRLAAAPSS